MSIQVKLINPRSVPFYHEEYAQREEVTIGGQVSKDVLQSDDKGQLKHSKSFKKNDVIELSPAAAEHLIITGEAELVNASDARKVFGGPGK